MKKALFFCGLMFTSGLLWAQESGSITLNFLYNKLEENYPLTTKAELQRQLTGLRQELSQTGWFPEFTVGASASYQSEATVAPFPGAPEFSKDHYSVSLEAVQPLYEAGRVAKLKKLDAIQGDAAEAGFEVEMNQLRSQVDQVFFGILNAQKQLEILDVLSKSLEDQLKKVNSLVENGVLLPGNQFVLEAEILKVKQQKLDVRQAVSSGFEVLEILTGSELEEGMQLDEPSITQSQETLSNRPEFELFEWQQQALDAQMEMTGSDKLPVVSAFGKTAYGRPGFDAFNDDLHFFWMVGVKAQWSFRNWRNSDKKAQVFELQKNQIQADEDAFSKQLNASIARQINAIETLNEQIELDEQVLDLRSKVVAEKQKQLDQGVITSTEQVTEINAENRARLDVELHKLQLVQANYELQRLRGNL